MDENTKSTVLNAVSALLFGLVLSVLGVNLLLIFGRLPITIRSPSQFTLVLLGLWILGGVAVSIPAFALLERTRLSIIA